MTSEEGGIVSWPRSALLIAGSSVRELRRAPALVALGAAALVLLTLFAFASRRAIDAARTAGGTETVDLVGATLLGTAAFAVFLLSAVVATFATHAAVRGDAERGLLQALLVRPVDRSAVFAGRTLAGAACAALTAATLWTSAALAIRVVAGWTPPEVLRPALALAAAGALVAVTCATLSTVLRATAAGAATLALVGLGITVGLLADLGAVLALQDLVTAADVVSAALPFEAFYREALAGARAGIVDLPVSAIGVGAFGGAERMALADLAWSGLWAVGIVAAGVVRARRLDV